MKENAKKYINIVSEELTEFINTIDHEALEKVAQLIIYSEKQGARVHVCGIGKPGYVAGYIASLLSSTGTKSYILDGTEAVHGSSGQVAEGDVVIAISNSGQTLELKATVETLLRNNAKVVAVTGNNDSWLAKNSSIALIAKVKQEGDSLNKPPRASILAEIIVLQALSIILQEYHELNTQQYIKWHPGGALGKSIKL